MSSEEERLNAEAKFWISIARKHGKQRWEEHKVRMIKKRGVKAVNKLTDEMNKIRSKSK